MILTGRAVSLVLKEEGLSSGTVTFSAEQSLLNQLTLECQHPHDAK